MTASLSSSLSTWRHLSKIPCSPRILYIVSALWIQIDRHLCGGCCHFMSRGAQSVSAYQIARANTGKLQGRDTSA